jgi:hypothetical protein
VRVNQSSWELGLIETDIDMISYRYAVNTFIPGISYLYMGYYFMSYRFTEMARSASPTLWPRADLNAKKRPSQIGKALALED